MKIGFFSSITAMLAGTSMALAQAPTPAAPGSPARTVVVQTQPMPAPAPAPGPNNGGVTIYPQPGAHEEVGPGGCCSAPCCAQNDFEVNPYRVFGGGEYLLWHLQRAPLPPLVAQEAGNLLLSSTTTTQTNGTVTNTVQQLFNVPVVFGVTPGIAQGTDVNLGYQKGARVFAGFWCDPEDTIGFEVRGFILEHREFMFNNTTANLNTGSVDTGFSNQLIIQTIPTATAGTQITTTSTTTQNTPIILNTSGSVLLIGKADESFWGVEANLRALCARFGSARLEVVTGYRTFDLAESMVTNTTLNLTNTVQPPLPPLPGPSTVVNGVPQPATTVTVLQPPPPALFGSMVLHDRISTRNIFYGAQLGLSGDVWCGRLNFKGTAKFGVGDMHQVITIENNNTVISGFGSAAGTVNGGGLLTGAADPGRHTHEKVCWFTDVNAQLGYLVCPWLRAYAGYDFLNLTQVARPGNQVVFTPTTVNVNIAGVPTNATVNSPGFTFFSNQMWVQGLSFGVELRF